MCLLPPGGLRSSAGTEHWGPGQRLRRPDTQAPYPFARSERLGPFSEHLLCTGPGALPGLMHNLHHTCECGLNICLFSYITEAKLAPPSSHGQKGQSWALTPSLTPEAVLSPLTASWKGHRRALPRSWANRGLLGVSPNWPGRIGAVFMEPNPDFAGSHAAEANAASPTFLSLAGRSGRWRGTQRAIPRLSELDRPSAMTQAAPSPLTEGKLRSGGGEGFARGHTG